MSVLSDSRREMAEETLLKRIKVLCKYCKSNMIRVVDLDNPAMVGYSCENCPHYNFLN